MIHCLAAVAAAAVVAAAVAAAAVAAAAVAAVAAAVGAAVAAAVAAAVDVAPIFGLGKLPVVVDVAAVATERCTSLQFCSSQLFKDDDDCGIQFFEWS